MRGIAILAGALCAGQAFATDLLTIYREALIQDSTYAGANAQYLGYHERLPQARALLLPSVNFGAATHYNDVNADYPNNPGLVSGHFNFYDYNYGAGAGHPSIARARVAANRSRHHGSQNADRRHWTRYRLGCFR